jgi:hypothetical protein
MSLAESFCACTQFLSGIKPVLIRRSLRATPGLPQFMSENRDVIVSKGHYSVSIERGRMQLHGGPVGLLGVLQRLPGVLVSGLMVLLLVRLRRVAMNVGGIVMQLGGPLMIFVVRSVVIAS